jgi:[NiFe] hydrogenase assembly HybE family chaperone
MSSFTRSVDDETVTAVTRTPASRPAEELALERVFEQVRTTRMAGLPLLNERLRVEAVGFRPWRGARVGALVTPWSVNLIIVAEPGQTLGSLRTGATECWSFPSGDYEFHGHAEPSIGNYRQCSLISPVLEFSSHVDAVAAARAALDALFTPAEPRRVSRRGLVTGT